MKKIFLLILLVVVLLGAFACGQKKKKMENKGFDTLLNGKKTMLFTLKNKNGIQVTLTNYGARAVSILVPDKHGKPVDIILGYDNLEGYLHSNDPYFGATVGRYANRIANGKFSIDGKEYTLAINDICGPNHLHGGKMGFTHVVWDAKNVGKNAVEFSYLSNDLEEGYPGNMHVWVTYTLTDDNALQINYRATTDAPTICNLTHHSYFNLNGAGEGDVLGHIMYINADYFTPVDKEQIPTGEIWPVKGTPFDFNMPTAIGARVDADDKQVKLGRGYNHNYVLNKTEGEPVELAVRVYSPVTGIVLEMFTDEPGVQFYSCGFMDGKDIGKGNKAYRCNGAFCLEAQHFPDSPNQANFPTTRLNPGEEYTQSCIYKFLLLGDETD